MAKKLEKNNPERDESYEKLRDELFEYRVDIKTYKRSMSILVGSVSVIVAICGFFGYNRIEALLNKVESNANARLARTDSLLAKVDMRFLDSLTAVVEERTTQYEEAIAALEKGSRVSNDMYKKLISSLSYNKRIEKHYDAYLQRDATNYFDLVFYSEYYKPGSTGECYVVMGEEYEKREDDMFLVEVFPRNRNIAIFHQTFDVQRNYNRLFFSFGKFEDYKEYSLRVILLRKNKKEYDGYTIYRPLSID